MQVQTGKTVLVDGETITAIVPGGGGHPGYTVIDLGGRYLMPGLINMHVHLAGNGKPQKKQRDNAGACQKDLMSDRPDAGGRVPDGARVMQSLSC